MRWVNRAAIAATLLCAGCGNYSTEDLVFLAALPQREDLRAEVPTGGVSGAATVCGDGPAGIWLEAKPASNQWNAGVELVVGLVDAVRRFPPTWRREDERGWGPFPDENHPGIEIQIVIHREFPAELNGSPRFGYAFQARRTDGTDAFRDVLTGAFEGPSAARGKGIVNLDFEALWTLGMNDLSTPHGTAFIAYDRTADPVTIFFSLYQDGFPAPRFTYGFKGWADGSGKFGYRYRDPQDGNVLTVVAAYGPGGAGRDAVVVTSGTGVFIAGLRQCWDSFACLLWVDDPWNLAHSCASAPCAIGSELDCPPVPEDPGGAF